MNTLNIITDIATNKTIIIIGIIILSLILVVCFLTRNSSSNGEKSKEEKAYDKFLKKIKKAFLNILVASNDIPDLRGKTIIKCDNIDDLVDISEVRRKPIYYIETLNASTDGDDEVSKSSENSDQSFSQEKAGKSCDFVLIHDNEACIYTLKPSNAYLSPLERYIDNLEKEKIEKSNQKLLQDVDKTMIIEIPDGSLYKVSPIKKGKGKSKKISASKVDDVDIPKLK